LIYPSYVLDFLPVSIDYFGCGVRPWRCLARELSHLREEHVYEFDDVVAACFRMDAQP